MQIIKQDNLNIEEVVEALENGAVIVYPTETCYGLGCDATNQKAVDRIFEIKQRQKEKSMPVIASNIAMMTDYVVWNKALQELADKYWPGPLTVAVKVVPGVNLARGIIAPDHTLAFRIANHPLAAELSEKLDRPLVSTSANVASLESPYDIADILKMFADKQAQPDIVIDAGLLPHHTPSTVVRVKNGGRIEVLRQGEIVVI